MSNVSGNNNKAKNDQNTLRASHVSQMRSRVMEKSYKNPALPTEASCHSSKGSTLNNNKG